LQVPPPSVKVIATVPLTEPITVGVNVTFIVQLAPNTIDEPQVFVWVNCELTVIDLIFIP
jgi:hypothetical protein